MGHLCELQFLQFLCHNDIKCTMIPFLGYNYYVMFLHKQAQQLELAYVILCYIKLDGPCFAGGPLVLQNMVYGSGSYYDT